jgi:hypothetical protein
LIKNLNFLIDKLKIIMEATHIYIEPIHNSKDNTKDITNDNSQDNTKDITKDNKDNKDINKFCEMFLIGFGILFVLFLIVGSVVWFVYGIIFLVNDYHVADDCSDSNLWAYVLVAVILYWQKVNAKNIGKDEAFGILICSAIIDFGLAIWGATELFHKTDGSGCNELEDSNLWKFGLATFIVQITYSSLIFLFLLSVCLISKYTSSENISETSPA